MEERIMSKIKADNVVVTVFEVESEAYQALTELKHNPGNEQSFVMEAVLVKKENGLLSVLDGFDTGADTHNDTVKGGMIGALVGILGGPIGVLLGGTYGAMIGSVKDADDALDDVSMLEEIAGKLVDGETAIIALAIEEDEAILDSRLGNFKGMILRFDADVVEAEVEEAREMEKEMARQARRDLRKEKKAARQEKKAERKEKRAERKEKIKDKEEARKEKILDKEEARKQKIADKEEAYKEKVLAKEADRAAKWDEVQKKYWSDEEE
jgi:hypothetical protein